MINDPLVLDQHRIAGVTRHDARREIVLPIQGSLRDIPHSQGVSADIMANRVRLEEICHASRRQALVRHRSIAIHGPEKRGGRDSGRFAPLMAGPDRVIGRILGPVERLWITIAILVSLRFGNP